MNIIFRLFVLLGFILTIPSLCSFSQAIYIGESSGGGIVFYIDGTGQHGLIAASSDQSTGTQWGCYGTSIGATGTAIGTGQANTTVIINGCSDAGIAARLCRNYNGGGYSDWFLPSQDELNQMYIQRNVIGGFSSAYYWSSSEDCPEGARAQYFASGTRVGSNRNNSYYVRAIRAFSCITAPSSPITGTNVPSLTQITWNWNSVSGATGYKWNTANDYSSATDMGNNTTKTETGLNPNTTYTRYVWAYNNCGNSIATTLSQILPFLIGQTYGGGIIFYIDGTGQHGLIAAPSDLSELVPWGCYGTTIGGTGTAIGTGQANTLAIISICTTTGIAAQLCDALILNGYNDWFLPSHDELYQMYVQRNVIGGFVTSNYYYWSSSEFNDLYAWGLYFFSGGAWTGNGKNNPNYVRAVRAF